MIKLALAAAALVAVGTTVYVSQSSRAAAPATAPSTPRATTPGRDPVVVAKPTATTPTPTAAPPAVPAQRSTNNVALDPDQMAQLDHATLERLHLQQGPARGPSAAPVTIVVFTDMLCTFCGKALGTIDQLFDEYPNKLRLVMKQMPVHTAAVLASEALLAADAQGKFWELHDLMMAHQEDLSHDALIALAQQASLDVPVFVTALDQHTYAAAVAADKAAAAELELNGAPSFVINGRRVIGIRNIEHMRAIIDQALADL